jgi:hypothetical protein
MIVRRGVTLLTLLVLSTGCDNGFRPTAPSPVPTPQPAPPTVRPPISGFVPATIYRFSGPLAHPVSAYTSESRFVLDDHGRFSLESSVTPRGYPGTYSHDNGVFTFQFDDDARWQATGTLTGDSMVVRYNLVMHLTDFEDAVYRNAPWDYDVPFSSTP